MIFSHGFGPGKLQLVVRSQRGALVVPTGEKTSEGQCGQLFQRRRSTDSLELENFKLSRSGKYPGLS